MMGINNNQLSILGRCSVKIPDAYYIYNISEKLPYNTKFVKKIQALLIRDMKKVAHSKRMRMIKKVLSHFKVTAKDPYYLCLKNKHLYKYYKRRKNSHDKKLYIVNKHEDEVYCAMNISLSFSYDIDFLKIFIPRLFIEFDVNFNINSISIGFLNMSTSKRAEFTFNKNFDFIKFTLNSYIDNTHITKDDNFLLSLEDELFILKLKLIPVGIINEILPEFNVPSAYDFKSDNFNERLKLFEIINY